MTFKDPVLGAINAYMQEHIDDSIRLEISVLMEILRCKQYVESPLVEKVLQEKFKALNALTILRPKYLEIQFIKFLKTVPFYKRAAFKASATTWKIQFYRSEREKAVNELLDSISNTKEQEGE